MPTSAVVIDTFASTIQADMLAVIEKAQPAASMLARTGWRIEVTRHGKYWQWRRGSGKNRESSYGGPFGQLSNERKNEYQKNRITHARTGARNLTAGSA